jgi:hypothetical protein
MALQILPVHIRLAAPACPKCCRVMQFSQAASFFPSHMRVFNNSTGKSWIYKRGADDQRGSFGFPVSHLNKAQTLPIWVTSFIPKGTSRSISLSNSACLLIQFLLNSTALNNFQRYNQNGSRQDSSSSQDGAHRTNRANKANKANKANQTNRAYCTRKAYCADKTSVLMYPLLRTILIC